MSTPSPHDPVTGWVGQRWKFWCVNIALVAHLMALGLMVASSGSGTFLSPPLVNRAAALTAPYVRFTGIQNGYRFFAPDPGPASLLWSRLTYDDGSVRWLESPG